MLAGPEDMKPLSIALEKLSGELGDYHRADADSLTAACHGPNPCCHGLLAIEAGVPVGAALVSPVFSATKRALGVYVSDLRVAGEMPGKGLGRRLLRKAVAFGAELWGAKFLKFAVYADNAAARAVYVSLGFRQATRDQTFPLSGPDFDGLNGEAQ